MYKTQVKGRTYDNRLPTVRKHFPYFYDFLVTEIGPLHVQNWQLTLSKRSMLPLISEVFKDCFPLRWIELLF